MTYFFEMKDSQYYVFQDNDPDYPFDGPMTKEEAEILTQNYNETPELDKDYIEKLEKTLKDFLEMFNSTFLTYDFDFLPLE